MNPEISNIARRYDWTSKKLQFFIISCRDINLQKQAVRVAEKLENWLHIHAERLGDEGSEDSANVTYTLSVMTAAIRHTISMWIKLKTERADEAWGELISAQQCAEAALRFHACAGNARSFLAHLQLLEQVLFPPMIFFSSGLIVGREDCSICQTDLENCDHIPGRLYKGRQCVRLVKEIVAFDHVAIVERPDDKRCIAQSFSVTEHRDRDRFTWRLHAKKVPDSTSKVAPIADSGVRTDGIEP